MFFSIIIPVYNSEKTLERCLESICAQSFADFEAVLVDDGSSDSSGRICELYAERDPRFRVIRQQNHGASTARNTGLFTASGKYICFVDSDDFVIPEYLCKLNAEIEKTGADAVFFGYHISNPDGSIRDTRIPPTGFSGMELAAKLSEKDMFGYTWIKCFSKAVIGRSAFPESMPLFEDEVFACSVLEKAGEIDVLPEALYYYVNGGENMLTGRTYGDYCVLSDKVFSAWERLMQTYPGREDYLQKKAAFFVKRCIYYGFERDVDVVKFFNSLSSTRYFQIHTDKSALERQIRNGNWLSIRSAKLFYKVKNRIHFR